MEDSNRGRSMTISPSHAVIVVRVLKHRFPWIGTDNEVSGADVVDDLNDLVDVLSRRRRRTGTRAGGARRAGSGGARAGSGRPALASDVSRITALRREGLTWIEVADQLNISVRTAQRAMKRDGR